MFDFVPTRLKRLLRVALPALGLLVLGRGDDNVSSLEGRVINRVTGEAVVAGEVRLLDAHQHVYTSTTNATGSYQFAHLALGSYRVQFARDGFADHSEQIALVSSVPVRLDEQLNPWGFLRGRVVDEDLRAIGNVRVEISQAEFGTIRDTTLTASNGDFAFDGLPPDSYMIIAKPEVSTWVEAGITLGRTPTYYPSVGVPDQAVKIRTDWGTGAIGITILLRTAPVHRLTGIVLDEARNPVPNATVKLLGEAPATIQNLGYSVFLSDPPLFDNVTLGPGRRPEVARVTSRSDGTFEFPAVQRGEWRLSVLSEATPTLVGVNSIVIREDDVVNVAVIARRSFEIPLVSTWQQPPEDAVPDDSFYLFLQPLDGQPNPKRTKDSFDGFSGLFPGTYRLIASVYDPRFVVSSVLYGGADVIDRVVEFKNDSLPLQMTLSHDVGVLRGEVLNGEAATIFLIQIGPGPIVQYRAVIHRPNGVFEFRGLASGDYYLVAFNHRSQRGLPAADLLDQIVPSATMVRVEAGGTASTRLRVREWPR